MNPKVPVVVMAIGGNALIPDNQHTSSECQHEIAAQLAVQIIDIIEAGWKVVLTHGNGPHVGMRLRSNELANSEVPRMSLDEAVSSTQGEIGYLLQKQLRNELQKRGRREQVATLITQVEVAADDVAFQDPQKPIGTFMDKETADHAVKTLDWQVIEDSGRGWRRVVPSPNPIDIADKEAIHALIDAGFIVIVCGGGGIPVIKNAENAYVGVEAVIDKDRTGALLAKQLNADLFLIPTGVEKVAIHFGKPEQQWLSTMSVQQAKTWMAEGQFAKGSMLPKVEAILDYLAHNPKGAGLITTLEAVKVALAGQTGTWIKD